MTTDEEIRDQWPAVQEALKIGIDHGYQMIELLEELRDSETPPTAEELTDRLEQLTRIGTEASRAFDVLAETQRGGADQDD